MPLPLPALRPAPLSRPCPGCFLLAARRRGEERPGRAGGSLPGPAPLSLALRPAAPAQPQRSAQHGHRCCCAAARGLRRKLSALSLPPSPPARPVPAPLSVFIPTPAGSGGEGLPALRQRRRAPIGLPPAAGVRRAGGGGACWMHGRPGAAPPPVGPRVCASESM